MESMRQVKGYHYILLAIAALAGLGLEVILVLGIEQPIYGLQMWEWSVSQNVLHWSITCILWESVAILLCMLSKVRYHFDLFEKAKPMKVWQWGITGICIVFMFVVGYLNRNGFKIITEYNANGLLKFIFQYIYYLFETVLYLLVIVFAQIAFEKWFNNEKIPYGGILLALTWGLAHTFTKGSLHAGMMSALDGFVYGIVYLLANRDIKKAYLFLIVMFML